MKQITDKVRSSIFSRMKSRRSREILGAISKLRMSTPFETRSIYHQYIKNSISYAYNQGYEGGSKNLKDGLKKQIRSNLFEVIRLLKQNA